MQGFCVKISSVRLLAQDLCMRISCARSLWHDVCIRILQDLLCKISLSGCLHQDSVGPRARSLYEIRNRNFTSISRDGHARSPQRVALRNPKSQFHLHSAHLTRTISAEGCTSKSEIAISPAFRALDTHDLRRGLHFEIQKRNFTCIPRTRHARSPQTVALRNPKTQFHLHSAHSTRTISAEGSHFETMLQKYCACHEIMSRGHTKCCTGHAKASPSSSSKNATPLRN